MPESTWIFTLFVYVLLCEHETTFDFCGTSWVWVSIFVFHNLPSPLSWTDACVLSPQPHDALTSAQHDYFILHFTPTFSHLSTSSFSFLLLSPSAFLSHQSSSVSLISLTYFVYPYSILSLSRMLNFQLSLSATLASLFYSPFSLCLSATVSFHGQATEPNLIATALFPLKKKKKKRVISAQPPQYNRIKALTLFFPKMFSLIVWSLSHGPM